MPRVSRILSVLRQFIATPTPAHRWGLLLECAVASLLLLLVALRIMKAYNRDVKSFKTSEFYYNQEGSVPDSLAVHLTLTMPFILITVIWWRLRVLTGYLMAFATAVFTTSALKAVAGELRPFVGDLADLDKPQARESFPSGHATSAFAAYAYIGLVAYITLFLESSALHRELMTPVAHSSKHKACADGSLMVDPATSCRGTRDNVWACLRRIAEILPGITIAIVLGIPLAAASAISLTRVREGFHSYGDVAAGAAIGLSSALLFSYHYAVREICALQQRNTTPVSPHDNLDCSENSTGVQSSNANVGLTIVS